MFTAEKIELLANGIVVLFVLVGCYIWSRRGRAIRPDDWYSFDRQGKRIELPQDKESEEIARSNARVRYQERLTFSVLGVLMLAMFIWVRWSVLHQ